MSKQKQKPDYVEYVIAMPKPVIEFLEANKQYLDYHDVEAYIEMCVLQTVLGDIESGNFTTSIKKLIEAILKGEDA